MKVLLLAGGNSNEREVSLTSGKALYTALRRLKHDVYAMDPTTGTSLISGGGDYITAPEVSEINDATPSPALVLNNALQSPDLKDVDVVFIGLHGGMGENGSLQNLRDLAGLKYTGSGMTASAVAMDKALSKRLFESVGILTPDWQLYRGCASRVNDSMLDDIDQRFSYPIIVKPTDSGSTIGLTKVDSPDRLRAAILTSLKESSSILVEKFIAGREVTVAVLDGRVFPVVEIRPKNGLYDYEAKYTKGKTEYIVPAEIPSKTAEDLQKAAAQAYDIIGAAGVARVDFVLSDDNRFYCLGLNTLPGMTDLSLVPMAAEVEGISFDKLLSLMIDSAMRK